MKKYIISFRCLEATDRKLVVKLRAKIETLSPDTWVHILENQLLVQSEKNIEELYAYLSPEAKQTRVSIAEFNDIFINDNDFDYELTDKGY